MGTARTMPMGISGEELRAANAYKKPIEVQCKMMDDPSTGPVIAEAMVQVLSKMDYAIVDDLEYVLVMIDEILEAKRSYAKLFRDLKHANVFKNILDLLVWEKRFAAVGTHVLGILFYPGLGAGEAICDKNLMDLVNYCRDELEPKKLSASTCRNMIDMLSCFIIILREYNIRKMVNEECRLHGHFSQLLESALELGDVQLLYQVGFCLWLLSYDSEIAENKMTQTNVVMNILKVIKTVSREKVIRVCMACLRNLVDKVDHSQMMIENDAMKTLAVLRNRKWTDDEVKEDLDFVYDSLAKSVHVLSSIEMYRKELSQGRLEWSPVHKSETFWKDNVTKLCAASGSVSSSEDLLSLVAMLKKLVSKAQVSMLDSEEATTVAVICHDLGEFARFHPNGKKILQSDVDDEGKSTKDLLMSIMSSPPGQSD